MRNSLDKFIRLANKVYQYTILRIDTNKVRENYIKTQYIQHTDIK